MNELIGQQSFSFKKLSYVTYFEVFIVQCNDKCDNSILKNKLMVIAP